MQTKAILQTAGMAGTMPLTVTELGWKPSNYVRTQLQVTGMGGGQSATIQGTPVNSSTATDIVGSAVANGDHVILSPDSGLFDSFTIVFTDAAAASPATVRVTAYDSAIKTVT